VSLQATHAAARSILHAFYRQLMCPTPCCVPPQLKRIVSRLRKQRAGMVQTPDQYMFCYQALKVRLAAYC
jgi:hypothetical protein